MYEHHGDALSLWEERHAGPRLGSNQGSVCSDLTNTTGSLRWRILL